MFTGIVEELGEVIAAPPAPSARPGHGRTGHGRGCARITVRAPLVAAGAAPGGSIAVSGVCLTVTDAGEGGFSADVMGETLDRTTLGALAPGDLVNLERPVRPDGRLDGHLVQGHVDATGVITDRRVAGGWQTLRVSMPGGIVRYVAQKGSVTIDGVSLTVSGVGDPASWFEVSLIPQTLARTTLGRAPVGAAVNLEADVIAKYVERLLAAGGRRA